MQKCRSELDHPPPGDVPSDTPMGGALAGAKPDLRAKYFSNLTGITLPPVRFPTKGKPMGRHTKYPYREWADGAWHDVNPADYGRTLASLRSILHQYAKDNRLKLRTAALSDGRLSIRFEKV